MVLSFPTISIGGGQTSKRHSITSQTDSIGKISGRNGGEEQWRNGDYSGPAAKIEEISVMQRPNQDEKPRKTSPGT
ncbi:hypothetical protein TNCV_384261 [Trichonephila clavipes]|nr:hypothetical protein TNCV_384261 [Trichonephila clavipes]